jgi:hypothetical protein
MYLFCSICDDFAAPIVSQTTMFAKRPWSRATIRKAHALAHILFRYNGADNDKERA